MSEKKGFEHYKFIADKGQNPLRIDLFLLNFIEFATRSKIQQSIKEGNVLVNDKIIKANYKVKPADVVTVLYNYPKEEKELVPQDIPLNIIYEDDVFLIINKVSGMVVHPGFGNRDGTLVNALKFHFDNLPNIGEEERPGLVHRLDKNTSGILVVAKTDIAMNNLTKQFSNRTIKRKYIALVWGDLKDDSGTITGNIGRSLKNRKIMSVFTEENYGKHAITHYKVLKRYGYTTLVECRLETGRTHQIRTHFKHLGHPIFNDVDYGGDVILKGTTFNKYKQFVQNCFKVCDRQALHAKSLAFQHPTTGNFVSFDSDLPKDMQQLIDKWQHYSLHKLS
ncbi:MAG: RluA family pseudouridine synthase [Bacteroidota bacterium]|nr:RluA family pseudouridine synthase [Bacteroidota bacterium]|tara:strand:+ start:3007 stop:4014 length:1008 start_codon:yes stop_codon:yes gene_type:complete